MAIDYSKELNPEQLGVVYQLDGPCLVIAGAGVGKTHLLTMRAARMLETGILPESVLTLTFTNKAAMEMKKRICKLIGENGNKITACTYHSFCAMTLRHHSNEVGLTSNFNITDEPEAIITKILKNNGYKGKRVNELPKAREIYSLITNEQVKGVPILQGVCKDYANFKEEIATIQQIADEFKSYKLQKNLVDYTDLLIMCRDLFKNHPDIAKRTATRYKYIMVDEYQDSNNIQCEMLKYLMGNVHNNIMVVGDDMQSIYAFTGANYKNILNFPKQFGPCNLNILERNYRSTQEILNLANAVIADAPYKFEKRLWSEDKEQHTMPKLVWTNNNFDMVDDVYRIIKTWKSLGDENRDIAILARTSNELNMIESAFVRDKIPYQKYGGLKFFEKAHIKLTMSFLRILSNYKDELAWEKILCLLPGLGEKTVESKIFPLIEQDGFNGLLDKKNQNKQYFPWLQRLNNFFMTATKDVITGQMDTYGNMGKPQASLEDQMEFLKNSVMDSLVEMAYPEDYEYRLREYDLLFKMINGYTTAVDFLNDIMLTGTPAQNDEKDNAITLSTVHSAKGLEWRNVIILNCVEGAFPSNQSIRSGDEENIEEERRLLYVAITRAKQELIMLCPHNFGIYGQTCHGELSRFLDTPGARFSYHKSDARFL